MAQIRPKQIKLDAEGDIIVGNVALGGGIVSKGADRTVLMAGGSTVAYEFVADLRDALGNVLIEGVNSPGVENFLQIIGGTAGNGPEFIVSGTDTNADIFLSPAGTGDVIVPNGYSPGTDYSLVNKAYVDSVATGLDFKNSVRVATISPTETSTFTYTGGGTDEWTAVVSPVFDGVTLVDGDRVLIKDASNAQGNGIWDYNSSLSKFIRADDADNSPDNEVSGGMFTFTEEGLVNHDTGWVLSEPNGNAVLGTDDLVFVQFSRAGVVTVEGGNGISASQNGTVFTVTADVDNATIRNTGGTGDQIAVFDGLVNQTLHGQGAASDATWDYTSSLYDSNGILILEGNASGTPVNYISATSANTTNGPVITSAGTDTNIDLLIEAKGTGRISLDGALWPKGPLTAGTILGVNSTDDVEAITAPDATGDQVLIFNDTTNQLEWVAVSTIGGNAWGNISLAGNTAGNTTIVPNGTSTPLTLTGGQGIELTGNDTTDTIDIDLAIDTLPVSATTDSTVDTIAFYDDSTGTHQQITLDNLVADVVNEGYDDTVASGGANEAFVSFFTNTPVGDVTVTVYFNGLALRAGGTAGWTRSGNDLALVDAVNGYVSEAGDIISATYRY